MIRAELLGLVTTTATRVAAAVAVLGLLLTQLTLVTLLPALAAGTVGPGAAELGVDLPVLDLASAAAQLDQLNPLGGAMSGGSIGLALVAVVLLGVLAGTSDDRSGGVVGAVLASPRRTRLVLAKAAAVGLGGLAVGVLLSLTALATLLGTLAATGTPVVAAPGDIAAALARGALAVAGLALIGLAVGILCRTQLAGVLVMMAVLVAEPVVAGLAQLVGDGGAPGWTRFLPVALVQSVVRAEPAGPGAGIAALGLVALVAALLAAASVALSRRDV